MPNPPKLIYWDSDVFISRFQKWPGRIDVLRKFTDAAERNEINLVVSTFSLTEIAKVPGLYGDPAKDKPLKEKQLAKVSAYFENDYIVVRPLTVDIAEMAREYVCKHGIKPGDAVHVATAIYWNVPLLHSYDERLCKRNGLIGDPPLVIENPIWRGQELLFENAEAPSSPIEDEPQGDEKAAAKTDEASVSVTPGKPPESTV